MADPPKSYRDTLNLPTTSFPMKADLTRQEPEQLGRWEADGVYRAIRERRRGQSAFILHDGPPYANGHIHIGHALNKILKDIIVKSKTMEGRDAPYIPGWDCHGLPIEYQVLKNLGPKKKEMSLSEVRALCREYADRFIAIQRDEFKRLGVFGDWARPYLTMTPDYEAAIVREFGRIVDTGSVYKGKKPVLWCPNDRTALAEAEVEYADHTSPSIYVTFPLRDSLDIDLVDLFKPHGISDPAMRRLKGRHLSVVIWTTTPWTLVANRAICVHPDLEYVLCIVGSDAYIVAQGRLKPFTEELGFTNKNQVIGPFKGSAIRGWVFSHPWLDQPSPIILGKHVTLEQGTGCVHTAPGHGQEDYVVGLENHLEVYAPVDDRGRFTGEAGSFSGHNVLDANAAIIDLLRSKGRLLHAATISHSYPHCWRCKNPVIFRATEQWFIAMDQPDTEGKTLRQRALEEIDSVTWIPRWGRERIVGMMANRPDWCISRQRVWGVPIVAFVCTGCRAPLFSKTLADDVADQMEQAGGSDIWFSKSAEELLPHGTTCPRCEGHRFEKEQDILDVWFESGVSHAAVLRRWPNLAWPADLYLEGSDQHRGWFHSSLLTALLVRPHSAPYRAVLTHGFVVDGEGKKMSKSAGNVVAPQQVIQQHGAEVLRLWVAAEDYRDDVRISPAIMGHLVEAYRKIRNTCRFLVANVGDFDPRRDAVGPERLHEIDRWMLHRLQWLIRRVREAYASYEFHTVFHTINNFCAVDLSAFYLDILKDRLYTSGPASPDRRAAQTVLERTLSALVRLMAPILSFTAEELWTYLPEESRSTPSVHLASLPDPDPTAIDDELAARWDRLIQIRAEVARPLEKARAEKIIGASLEAHVVLYAGPGLFPFLHDHEAQLATLFIVSGVELARAEGRPPSADSVSQELAVVVSRAAGSKCARCWTYRTDVGADAGHPTLCARCAAVLRRT